MWSSLSRSLSVSLMKLERGMRSSLSAACAAVGSLRVMYSRSLSLAAVGLISADANETLTAYGGRVGGVKQDEVVEETRVTVSCGYA